MSEENSESISNPDPYRITGRVIKKILSAAFILTALCFSQAATGQDGKPEGKPGIGVDAKGGQVIDPTKNVLDLVQAAIQRQDDLRAATKELLEAKLAAAELLNELRYKQSQELANALADKLSDEAKLRFEFSQQLAVAEAKRIDAIRAVDVGAAANLATRTTEQATALATVVNQSAEVLRNQVSRAAEDTRALVATTAATQLQNQQQQFSVMATRLSALEQAGAEGLGKQKYQDPALAALVDEVRNISRKQTDAAGVGAGRGEVIGWIVAGLTLLIAFAGLVFLAMRNQPARR
jgi:hypothetical protein